MNAPAAPYSRTPSQTQFACRLICTRPAGHDQINGEVSPVLFDGQTIKVDTHDGGLAELRVERGSEAVNNLDALTFGELRRAIDTITATAAIQGVLINSAKDNSMPDMARCSWDMRQF
jgi:hypothetical protein